MGDLLSQAPRQKDMALFMRIEAGTRWWAGLLPILPLRGSRVGGWEERSGTRGPHCWKVVFWQVQSLRVGSPRPQRTISWNETCSPRAHLFPSPFAVSADSAP